MKPLVLLTALILTLLRGELDGALTVGDSYPCVTDMATGFAFDKSRKE